MAGGQDKGISLAVWILSQMSMGGGDYPTSISLQVYSHAQYILSCHKIHYYSLYLTLAYVKLFLF